MGTSLRTSSVGITPLQLTPNEMEICSLHFVDGHSQPIIAEWLGVTLQAVRQCIARSLSQYPQLRKSRRKIHRPRIIPFSQLRGRDRAGPFNVDEL